MSRTPIERWSEKVSLPKEPDGCWEWTAATQKGYGAFGLYPKVVRAHRFGYERFIGPIPEGLDLDHTCRNRLCVNPEHLEPVTRQVNLLRGPTRPARNVSVTHCPFGHEYAGANLYFEKRGPKSYRRCRACSRRKALVQHYRLKGG